MKNNYQDFKAVIEQNNIKVLYHFTDRANLQSIIDNGGLFSWKSCEDRGIRIAKAGGDTTSRNLDKRDNLQDFVRLSFCKNHPMKFVAMNDGRISDPVLLEIDPEVILWKDTRYSDMNATKTGVNEGGQLENLKSVHFATTRQKDHFDLTEDEAPYYQAEVLVKTFIPLDKIINISQFGIKLSTADLSATQNNSTQHTYQAKESYSAQISRANPTAFIFMIDQSASMGKRVMFNGEQITMSEVVARLVNQQINELILRCVKSDEIRNYYDIAVVGYGSTVSSGWNGELNGRYFVSPEELSKNPYKKIIIREEKRTRKGVTVKEVEKTQWIEAKNDGRWTNMHGAFVKVKELLEEWIDTHGKKDSYPPTIINITDGEYNNSSHEKMLNITNEIKSLFTNDGNIQLFNIHISNNLGELVFPLSKDELGDNKYGCELFDFSSLLPVRYNDTIAKLRVDKDNKLRHKAMAINTNMSTLIQLMDIGTPTNISQNK